MVPGMSNSLKASDLRTLKVAQPIWAVTFLPRKRARRALKRLKSSARNREPCFASDPDALLPTAPQELADEGLWSSRRMTLSAGQTYAGAEPSDHSGRLPARPRFDLQRNLDKRDLAALDGA